MSLTLADLQQNFASALQYQTSGEECHIKSDHFTAEERIQIYRNNFIIGLTDVLQATYPMVHVLVGEECFTQLARQHILNSPLKSGNVSHYGEHFASSIENFPRVMEAAPYIQEVAKFEWQIDLSEQILSKVEPSKHLLSINQLSTLPQEQHQYIKIHLSPNALTFQSSFAVFSLRLAIEANDFSQLDINHAEQGVIMSQYDGPYSTVKLNNTSFELVEYLTNGYTLGQIPETHLACLETLLEHQFICGFSLAPHQ